MNTKTLFPKALFISCFTMLTAVTGNIAHANGGFTIHARVLNVQPVYHYVTIKEPKHHCEIVHNRNSRGFQNQRFQNQRFQNQQFQNQGFRNQRFQNQRQRSNFRGKNTNAAIVGGVLGGVIGNQLTRSRNGRGSVGATIAGAAIGATLAKAAVGKGKSSSRQFNSNHGFSSHKVSGKKKFNNGFKKCYTTTVSRKERRLSGYDVTYFHKGRKLHTRTDYHPGNRIAVRVKRKFH